jgi:hypothetical protein
VAKKKKDPTLAEEAGLPEGWKPVESEPINPSMLGAPSNSNKMTPFFDGSISPTMQHDTTFVGTKYGTPSIPVLPLMPMGASAISSINSAIQSIIGKKSASVISSAGLIFRGVWNSFTTYAENDVVLFNISAYIAVQSNTNVEPDTSAISWTLLSENIHLRGQWVGTVSGGTPTYVQSAKAGVIYATGVAQTLAFPGGNAVGNTLFAFVSYDSGTPGGTFTVTDSNGNLYTQIGTYLDFVSIATWRTAVFVTTNCKAGANTVSVVLTENSVGTINVAEYTGGGDVSAVTAHASNQVQATSNAVTLSTTFVNQVIVLFDYVFSGNTPTPPVGFTQRQFPTGGVANEGVWQWDGTIAAISTAVYTVSNSTNSESLLWGIAITTTSTANQYYPFDTVEYLGSTYICILKTTVAAEPPTNTAFWTQLSQGTGSVTHLSGAYAPALIDYGTLLSNSTSSNFTVTLPSPPPLAAWWVSLQNSGAGSIIINPNGLQIDGSLSNLTLSTNQGLFIFTDGVNYFTLRGDGVTSVGLSLPNIFIVSGSPVTSAGTLTAVLANEAANTVFAGPISSANPAFVQIAESYIGSPTTPMTAGPLTNTSGNTLVVVIGFENHIQSSFSISDTLGNTWIDLGNQSPASGNHASRVFYVVNCLGGANTVSISWVGTGVNLFLDIAYLEYSGISAFDSRARGSSSSPYTSPSTTTTHTTCMLIGVGDDGESTWTAGNIGGSTGNLRTAASVVPTRNLQRHGVQDNVVTSTGTYTSAMTNGLGAAGTAWILAFASGGFAAPTFRLLTTADLSGLVSIIVASVNLTNQTANTAATTLYAVGASGAGLYRVTVYLIVSQAATTSSTLPDSRIIFTDQDSSATITVPVTSPLTGNTLSTFAQAVYEINAKASTNIQYDIGQVTGYASSGGTPMKFAYRARLEYLG